MEGPIPRRKKRNIHWGIFAWNGYSWIWHHAFSEWGYGRTRACLWRNEGQQCHLYKSSCGAVDEGAFCRNVKHGNGEELFQDGSHCLGRYDSMFHAGEWVIPLRCSGMDTKIRVTSRLRCRFYRHPRHATVTSATVWPTVHFQSSPGGVSTTSEVAGTRQHFPHELQYVGPITLSLVQGGFGVMTRI